MTKEGAGMTKEGVGMTTEGCCECIVVPAKAGTQGDAPQRQSPFTAPIRLTHASPLHQPGPDTSLQPRAG